MSESDIQLILDRLDRMEAKIDAYIDKIDHILFGNGSAGLCEQMRIAQSDIQDNFIGLGKAKTEILAVKEDMTSQITSLTSVVGPLKEAVGFIDWCKAHPKMAALIVVVVIAALGCMLIGFSNITHQHPNLVPAIIKILKDTLLPAGA